MILHQRKNSKGGVHSLMAIEMATTRFESNFFESKFFIEKSAFQKDLIFIVANRPE